MYMNTSAVGVLVTQGASKMDRNGRSNVTMKRGFPRTKHQPVWIYLQGSPCRSTRMSPKDRPVHRVDDIHNLEIQNRNSTLDCPMIWIKSNKHPKKQMYIQDESDKLFNLPCDLNSHPFHHNTSLSRLMLSDLLLYAQKLESPGHGEEVQYTNRRNTLEIIRKEMSKNISLVHPCSF